MIGYIESGATMPSVATIELLASALRVSPCWLAFAEGEPHQRADARRSEGTQPDADYLPNGQKPPRFAGGLAGGFAGFG